jgi:hypothetical protein
MTTHATAALDALKVYEIASAAHLAACKTHDDAAIAQTGDACDAAEIACDAAYEVADAARFAAARRQVPRICAECSRVFDLLDDTDAQEWYYGHDCE